MSKTKRKSRKRRRGRSISLWYLGIPVGIILLVGVIWLLSRPSPISETIASFPPWLKGMPFKVQKGYATAVLHREELQYIPCYCGCGGLGHTAVIDCFIAEVTPEGRVIYDTHAST